MIKIGVIGLGEVSQLMHLPILHDLHEEYKITAVSDIAPSLVSFIQSKYGVKEQYLSAEELIKKADIDAVLILSPDQHHGENIVWALESGKHVFVEKPATLSSKELENVIEAHKKYPKQIVMVGYMRRYSNVFLKAKEILDAKKTEYLRFRDIILEAPFFIRQTRPVFYPNDASEQIINEGNKLRRKYLDEALGAGASDHARISYQMLTGLGSHSFSAVRELFGLPKKILSVAAKGEHLVVIMDYGDFLASYELVNNQNIVQFDAAIEIYQNDRKLHIKYETPYLRYQPMTLSVTESGEKDTRTILYGPDHTDPFMTQLKHFYDCVKNGRQPKTTLEDSLSDLKLFEEIVRMAEKGGN